MMRNPEGEANLPPLRLHFDRRLKLEFHGSRITSDAGLLAYHELEDALGLTSLAGSMLADSRTGKNGWHGLVGLLRQSVYGRLAGYEDVNDADRHRDQPRSPRRAGRRLLQSAWHGGAAHQGRQARHPVDTPVLSQVRPQRRSPATARARLQPRELSANLGPARRRAALVDDDAQKQADQDRRQDRAPRALRYLPDG